MFDFLKAIVSYSKNFKSIIRLSIYQISLQHKLTYLGPVWIVLQNYIFIGAISFIFVKAFNDNLTSLVPYFASGFIIWQFLSSNLKDSCNIYRSSRGLILSLPEKEFFVFFNVYFKNLIIFLYNFAALIVLLLFLGKDIKLLQFLLNFIILSIISILFSYCLSIICVKFVDISKVFASFLQIMFFLSPIVWKKQYLAKYLYIHDYNIFYVLVQVCRAPLIDQDQNLDIHYQLIFIFIILSFAIASILYKKFHKKIVYWI